MIRVGFYVFLLAAVAFFALRRGGAPERWAIAAIIAMIIADMLTHIALPLNYNQFDIVHFSIDLLGWSAFLFIALYARRFWPLCASALQTITLISHPVRLLDLHMAPEVYGIMQVMGSYPILVTIGFGVWAHYRRQQSLGNDPPWLASLPPLIAPMLKGSQQRYSMNSEP